jgi:uncharacterized membrane protein YsdA (DUF1294 family)
MQSLLIIYVIAINLIGFFIMGIDKRRAIRQRWRVPERTLFLIALLFGSIGMLFGMYVFHHKTRHTSFAIGIPAIMLLQFLLIALLFSWHSQQMSLPSQAVAHELSLIQELDSDTIHSFVSYENLSNHSVPSAASEDSAAEAVNLFFQNFHYNILNEQIEDEEATVSVNITNLDMHALAQDLCRSMLRDSAVIYPDADSSVTTDYYQPLCDTLQGNTYEQVVTTAYFHLRQDETGWTILSDSTLEDELVSGFISYINDPYLLPADEVLSIHLDALKALSADQWIDYLSIEDLFSTWNTDYASQIDAAYAKQLASSFDYRIIKCTESRSDQTADAVVRITSIDMKTLLQSFREQLRQYASSSDSMHDDQSERSNETCRLLLSVLTEQHALTTTDVDLTLHNNGSIWDVTYDDVFCDAVMGQISSAIDAFQNDSSETDASDGQQIQSRY